jgi:hypothetical protein
MLDAMTQPNDRPRQQIAVLRLDGKRFNARGIPAAALVEVVAFEELVREIAKALWRQRHPGRKRVPNGYDDDIELRLVEIREGSAVSVLERAPSASDDLFDEEEIISDLDSARVTVEKFIEAAISGAEVPELFSIVPKSKLKKFGQSLRADEAMQVAPDDGDWRRRSQYTSNDRHRVLIRLTGTYTGEASIDGVIENISITQRTCLIRTDAGNTVSASWAETGVRFEVDDHVTDGLSCHVDGIGEYDRDGVLTRFLLVESFALLNPEDRADEELDNSVARAKRTLRALSNLELGWIDGESGSAISPTAMHLSQQILDALASARLVTESIFPTEQGGVQFEWRGPIKSVSLEVEPSGGLYLHLADLTAGSYEDRQLTPTGDHLDQLVAGEISAWLDTRIPEDG